MAEIIRLGSVQKIPLEKVPRGRLDGINSGHQGVALEAGCYPYITYADILDLAEQYKEPPWILILDTMQDPQNLGTLLRTAEVVGVHGVLLPYRHSATITPAVVNASSGATEHLLITQGNLAQVIGLLKEAGLWIIGLDNRLEASLPEQVHLDGPLALVVGNEGQGMRSLVRKSCDQLLRIPMRGKVESLNASVAGSIALYMAMQARNNLEAQVKSIDSSLEN